MLRKNENVNEGGESSEDAAEWRHLCTDELVHYKPGMQFSRATGEVIMCVLDEQDTLLYPNVQHIQIDSVAEIEIHHIERTEEGATHTLIFRGGGALMCTIVKGRQYSEVMTRQLASRYNQDVLYIESTLDVAPLLLKHGMDISSVGDITTHDIFSMFGMTTHLIKNRQGHDIEFAYNNRGECISYQASLKRRPE